MTTPVSGPGQFSKRTDKAVEKADSKVPDAAYGEQKAYQEQKAGAPLAKADFASMFGNPAQNVVPLHAPSSQPEVPVTSGAAEGPGAGVEALGLPDQSQEDMQRLVPYLPVLEFMANQPGASWAMRNVVRKTKAMT